jgi:hypothetical protein
LSSIPTAIVSRRIAAVPSPDPTIDGPQSKKKGRLAPALPC